eukprot:Skav225322  [mRNA]  locus=scaffold891:190935:199697:- [translate_table: standard]
MARRLRAKHILTSEETGNADVRCAFYLLEASDVRLSTTAALDEKLRSVCQSTNTPVTVNVSQLSSEHFKWDDLHQKLYHDEDCHGVQASLKGSSSFLQIAVRNILESSLRAMSVRAVSSAQAGAASKKLVTELIDSDVAFVGGELLGETLRTTCKAKGQAVPDLELLTGPRVLALDFQKAMDRAKRSCSTTTKMILEALPTSTLGSAADIEIKDDELKKVFAELDELIGLASVKRAMREFYATVVPLQMFVVAFSSI